MPSNSYKNFRKNIIDVQRLIRDYHTLSAGYYSGRGRRALDHITRSGVLLLAGAWEVYIEEVLFEAAGFMCIDNPASLPKEIKQEISKYVRKHNDETKEFTLAGNGWKQVYLQEIVLPQTENLNTPKSHIINDLFKRLLGIEDISQHWPNRVFIDEFMTYRGALAHGVKSEEYLKVDELASYLENIRETVKVIDQYLLAYLKGYFGIQPWNRVY